MIGWQRKIVWLIFSFLASINLIADQTLVAEVYFKKIIWQADQTLTLKDLVQSCNHSELLTRMSKLKLELDAEQITVYPVYSLRKLLASIYEGALITVGGSVLIIPEKKYSKNYLWFYDRLASFLLENQPLDLVRLGFELISPPDFNENEASGLNFEYQTIYTKDVLRRGYLRLNLVSQLTNRKTPLEVYIHPYVNALVPLKNIKAGESFKSEALQEKVIDLALCSDEILLASKAAISYSALSELKAGEPIFLKKIVKALYVKTGDKITLVFLKKNLRIEISGRALSSGSLDDRVKVRAEGTNKIFSAKVIGEKEAEIEL